MPQLPLQKVQTQAKAKPPIVRSQQLCCPWDTGGADRGANKGTHEGINNGATLGITEGVEEG